MKDVLATILTFEDNNYLHGTSKISCKQEIQSRMHKLKSTPIITRILIPRNSQTRTKKSLSNTIALNRFFYDIHPSSS